jgi:hypothetical protein
MEPCKVHGLSYSHFTREDTDVSKVVLSPGSTDYSQIYNLGVGPHPCIQTRKDSDGRVPASRTKAKLYWKPPLAALGTDLLKTAQLMS